MPIAVRFRTLRRRANLTSVPNSELGNRLGELYSRHYSTGPRWNNLQQQQAYNAGMEALTRPNRNQSLNVFARLVLNLLHSHYDVNTRSRPSTTRQSTRTPRYSNTVYRVVSKWRRGPVRLVPLAGNAPRAVISLHNFKKGHEAIRHTRRTSNGRVANRYYTVEEFEKLVGKSWPTVYRKKPSNLVFGNDPMNHRRIYRRNLSLVKFI